MPAVILEFIRFSEGGPGVLAAQGLVAEKRFQIRVTPPGRLIGRGAAGRAVDWAFIDNLPLALAPQHSNHRADRTSQRGAHGGTLNLDGLPILTKPAPPWSEPNAYPAIAPATTPTPTGTRIRAARLSGSVSMRRTSAMGA